MKHAANFAFLTGLITALAGCTEKLDPQPAAYSRLLTGTVSKTWRLSSFQILSRGRQPETFSAFQLGCEGDDLYVFYAGEAKKFQVTEGPLVCEAGPDLIVENTWSLVNANATLVFAVPFLTADTPIPFVVKSLTPTNLTVEFYTEDADDVSYRCLFVSKGEQ